LRCSESFRHDAGIRKGLQAFLWNRLGVCTAETLRTPSKEVLIKKSSDLCELGASVVNPSSQKTRNNHKKRGIAIRPKVDSQSSGKK
jgi:hypothetical protein